MRGLCVGREDGVRVPTWSASPLRLRCRSAVIGKSAVESLLTIRIYPQLPARSRFTGQNSLLLGAPSAPR